MTKRLINTSRGSWKLEGEPDENPRTFMYLDPTFTTECDEPHPVKMRVDTLGDWYTERGIADYVKDILLSGGKKIQKHTKSEGWVEYLTWLCPGHEEHHYSQWTVMVESDWTENVYDTFGEARQALEEALGEKVKLSVPRKPKRIVRETVIDPATGAATWKACGHRAELDINEQCYTCHGDV